MYNNLIYTIGDCNIPYGSCGVIECFDIRYKKWFEIDELINIFNNNHNNDDGEIKKRWFQYILNCIWKKNKNGQMSNVQNLNL